MTGYWGGATATNERVGDASFIGPVLAGVFVWAGRLPYSVLARGNRPLYKEL